MGMKKILLVVYLLGFLIFSNSLMAQLTLRDGEQKLEDKYVFFKKGIKCKVIPKVKYYKEHYDQLEISFEAEWYDKKNEKINDQKNAIYLIDNYDRFTSYHERNDKTIQYDPSVDVRNEPVTIQIKQLNNVIPSEPFKNGFMGFTVSSKGSVLITSLNPANGPVEISFRFLHVIKGSSLFFRSFAQDELTWSFLLPEKKVKGKDCKELENDFAEKIDLAVDGNQLTYFQVKLKEKKVKIEKLEEEFAVFKESVSLAEDLLIKIENNPDFDNCNELKTKYKSDLNAFLAANEDYTPVELKIKELIAKPIASNEVKKSSKSKDTKTKQVQSKTFDWEKLESKYEKLLASKNKEYKRLNARIESIAVDITSSIDENSEQLDKLAGIENVKGQLTVDSLEMINDILSIIGDVSSENSERISSLQKETLELESEIDNDLNKCISEFSRGGREEGKKKSWKYRKGFNDLIDNLTQEETFLEEILSSVIDNYDKYYELITKLDPDRSAGIQEITELLEEKFATLYSEFLTQNKEFEQIKADFEEKRYSNWFFKGTKKKLLKRTDQLNENLARLDTEFDSLLSYKDKESMKNNIEFFIDEEHEIEKVSIGLSPAIGYLKTDIEEWPHDSFPYFYLILIIVVVLILVFGGRVYYKAIKKERKAKQAKANPDKPSGGVVLMQSKTDNSVKGKGLVPVRKLAGIDFIELDMSEEWDDTAVRKVYMHKDCIKKTYRFFEDSIRAVGTESTANETGGYLIGRWDVNPDDPSKYDVSLEDFIEPGDDATFSRYQLNFGAKIGVKLQKTLENCRQKEGLDFVLTSWFHSHPGLKIFLSDYDLTVQEDFSPKESRKRMIALVLDPYTPDWDLGIFTYKTGGEMNNSADSKKFYSLEKMYQWALGSNEPKKVLDKPEGPNNYFSAHIHKIYPNTTINNVFFSNSCILEVKRHIEDNNNPLSEYSVFLGGYKLNNDSSSYDVTFENVNELNLVEGEIKTKYESLGFLVTTHDENPNFANILSNPVLAKNQIPLLLVYSYPGKTLCLVSRTKEDAFNNPPAGGGKILFNDMINWTRKRK